MKTCAQPLTRFAGEARVPGDKSLSHRALLLGALAVGSSTIEGLLESEDVRCTATALAALGVGLERTGPGCWRVDGVGVGGLAEPAAPLELGNAGTGVRLLMGVLAGHPFTAFLTGDASLCARPMGRVMRPLERMGARFLARSGERLPLAVTGSHKLVPIQHRQSVPSAQVKSAVLLAGLHAPGRTTVIEPEPSRDHTERLLRHLGAEVASAPAEDGSVAITVTGQPELGAARFAIPGDPSSAAFPLVATLLAGHGRLRLEGVGVNPLRTGLLECLLEMGAQLQVCDGREISGEPVADVIVEPQRLHAIDVPAERAPRMIDEYPILAVAAACAQGRSRLRGLAELRVKESDRLSAIAAGLSACGIQVAIEGDDLLIDGVGGAPRGGATIDARLDHRIAMSFLVLGGASCEPVTVEGAETIATSFPGFVDLMNRLGARIEVDGGAP